MNTPLRLILTALIILTLFAGCRGDMSRVRGENTAELLAALDNRTQEAGIDDPLSLDECIAIALEHNLDIRLTLLEQEIAGYERKIAFSNFLPQVNASASQQWYRHDPTARLGGQPVQISDRRYRDASISLQQPIFVPYTWFLYDAYRKGEEISEIVVDRTRQQIALQITSLFYRCSMLTEAGRFVQSAYEQAESLAHEVRQQRAVGLARAGDAAEVEALLAARTRDVAENIRQQQQAHSELLEAMGLNPFSPIMLAADRDLPLVAGSLEDCVMEALLQRPELHIQDRVYEIERDRVKAALAAFLPEIYAGGAFSYTTDSFVRYSSQWIGGITGVMSLFNGFADVNAYKAARRREKAAYVRREQACMMIMLQVQQAWLNMQTTMEDENVSAKMLFAREQQLRERKAEHQQELTTLSEYLTANAMRDGARMEAAFALFAQQVAVATLHDVLGRNTNIDAAAGAL